MPRLRSTLATTLVLLALAGSLSPAAAQPVCNSAGITGLPPRFQVFDAAGGSGTLGVVSWNPPCTLIVTSDSAWMAVAVTSPTTFTYVMTPNPTVAQRVAYVTIGVVDTEIRQAGRSLAGTPGAPVLVWQNRFTGSIEAWMMNGSTMAEAYALRPPWSPDMSWNLAGRADFDRDGYQDLLWENRQDGRLHVWYMAGAGRLETAWLSPELVADTRWQVAALADLDRDGNVDIVWQHHTTGALHVWYMSGTRRIAEAPLDPDRVGDVDWKIVGTMDANNDGWPDLVWQHLTQGLIAVWLMHDRTLISSEYFSPSRVDDPRWRIVDVVDANADATADLLFQHQGTGAILIAAMDGLRIARTMPVTPDARSAGWAAAGPRLLAHAAPGDIDGDGAPDLLVRNASGDLQALLMTGSDLRSRVAISRAAPGPAWRLVGLADFDLDGRPDALWQDDNGALSLWLMNGAQVRAAVGLDPAGDSDSNWLAMAAYDVNGDGHPDIVWQNRADGRLRAWLMNGVTCVQVLPFASDRANDPGWRIVGAGDFNGDGAQDLLWWHPIDGWIQVWHMNAGTRLASVMGNPDRVADTNWRPRGVADMNLDGMPDIVWEHVVDGYVQCWYMHDAVLIDSAWAWYGVRRGAVPRLLGTGTHIVGTR